MSTKDIWYGVLEAGEKSSPVVRDASIDTSQNKVYLYNHVRGEFVEYAQAIVEPKLRDLTAEDISQDELDKAFRAARKNFASSHRTSALSDAQPTAKPAASKSNEDYDIDEDSDEDMEDFIDDDD
jgi:hypothetical protein